MSNKKDTLGKVHINVRDSPEELLTRIEEAEDYITITRDAVTGMQDVKTYSTLPIPELARMLERAGRIYGLAANQN